MKGKKKIEVLFKKYIENTISENELSQFHAFSQMEENQKQLEELMDAYFLSDLNTFSELHEKSGAVESLAWAGIQKNLGMHKSFRAKKSLLFTRFAAAAAVVLLMLSLSLYFINMPWQGVNFRSKDYGNDIQPGTNRATLISSTGMVYKLSESKEEVVIDKNSIRYKDGTVVADQQSGQDVTLSTPRGGQYRVTLVDGTKVWLNAASSLSYPTNFTGKERRVRLVGEAYFEVAHNAKQPFIVTTDGQQVKVLGTSFNLNAYREEHKTVTTLVNGHVQLSTEGIGTPQQLFPGEQAVLQNAGFEVAKVDAALFGSWKDGQFRFKATPLVEALRQIERWYDLDVDYTGIPTDIQIHASISRDKKLSTVIHALEKISDLKFDVKGRSVKLMR